eukprot:TRINITY_DN491_c0_g1_i4.p1 TRINITY_DN491_c0_g1~~TRINITY_DN491_c0_g1_i4.p1  ORF type:complete len:611 (+),score=66.14 TRINITY_DN491_c0_g1_i4:84-1916(+)
MGGPIILDGDQNTQQRPSDITPEEEATFKRIYMSILLVNILVNLDHGILPAATKEIRRDLKLNDVELGVLGSIVYLGLVLGSILAGYLFQKYTTKDILCITILLNMIALAIFPLSNLIGLLAISRFMVGCCQVFLTIFFPVWVDKFGYEKKTMWITYLQLGVPLGIVIGYIVTAIFASLNMWRASFYIQMILLLPGLLIFARTDQNYLSAQNDIHRSAEIILQTDEEHYLLTMSPRASIIISPQDLYEPLLEENDKMEREMKPKNENTINILDEDFDNTKITWLNNFKILWRRKIYLYSLLAISALLFVATGTQFWISDYFHEELHTPKEEVYFWFALTLITSPTSGVVFGGKIVTYFGGYSGRHTIKILLIFGICASLLGLMFPFLKEFRNAIVTLWIVLFFGGAVMPPATGLMISALPTSIRAFGSSNAQLIQNLIGYLPAPTFYGVIKDIFNSRVSMIFLMGWSIWGVLAMYLAHRYQQRSLEQKMQRNIQDIYEIVDDEYEDEEGDQVHVAVDKLLKKTNQKVPLAKGTNIRNSTRRSTRKRETTKMFRFSPSNEFEESPDRIKKLNSMYLNANRFTKSGKILDQEGMLALVSVYKGVQTHTTTPR